MLFVIHLISFKLYSISFSITKSLKSKCKLCSDEYFVVTQIFDFKIHFIAIVETSAAFQTQQMFNKNIN